VAGPNEELRQLEQSVGLDRPGIADQLPGRPVRCDPPLREVAGEVVEEWLDIGPPPLLCPSQWRAVGLFEVGDRGKEQAVAGLRVVTSAASEDEIVLHAARVLNARQ
jgi:hypothetical protein